MYVIDTIPIHWKSWAFMLVIFEAPAVGLTGLGGSRLEWFRI